MVKYKYDFLHEDKHQSFLQVVSILFTGYDRFILISLQYLKKEKRDEVDFLLADEHQILLQVDINLGGHGQACPNYPK